MKKFAKMSLVAAVAVAGMTSVNAAELTEAIKGVEVSGLVRYRYDDTKTEAGANTRAHTQVNDYDAEMNIKVPVNDMVTANLKLDVAADLNDTTGDAKANVQLEDVYFTFNTGYATIMAGKQNLPGPFTDGAQGTGLVALVPAGPVTVAGGYFNNHSVTGVKGQDAMAAAILGSFGPVNAAVWYADVDNTLDTLSVSADANIGPVKVAAMHTKTELEANGTIGNAAGMNEASLTKLTVSGNVGPVALTAAYATTGDDNGKGNNRVSIDNDSDAGVEFQAWQQNLNNKADADAFLIGASMEVMPKVTAGVRYLAGDYKAAANDERDFDELIFDAAYQMSSNFKVSARYSMAETDNAAGAAATDSDKGRLELLYTF